MNPKLLFLAFALFLCSFRSVCQNFNTQDSLALVDLYNATNGPGWVNHTNWLTAAPARTWFGVISYDSVRVNFLALPFNNLTGVLPASIANFNASTGFDLAVNHLVGPLPSSLSNLSGVDMNLSQNQLSGALPDFNNSSTSFTSVNISYNNFSFATLDPYCVPCHAVRNVVLYASPQADLPLIENGNTLSIAAGGSLPHNTYTWYKNGVVVATKMGDSTYAMTGAGVYSVAVSNSNVQAVTLYSIQNTDTQDSLALIDLYNSTNGSNWRNNRNWATSAPVATWFGIRISFGRVKEISLSDNNLTGSLPPSLGSLPSLTSLNIGDKQLTGTIPASLGNLSNLKTLIIGGCSFSGSIPPSLGNLHALQLLSLTDDQLTGSIPPELGNLKNVFNIILSTNQLSDTIPAALGNCTSLQEIFLDNNRVSGTIPASLGRLTNLWNLQLHDNRLTGPIPDSICYIPLAHLGLSNNALIGSLPDSLGRMGTLFDIQLQNNNLSGAIKADFSNYAIDSLFVSGNRYNFSVLPIKFKSGLRARYAPQQAIPLTRVQRTLSVSAGGNPANSTFTLFRNGTLISTQTGDSAFSIAGLGNYNIIATNTDAPLLTLYSDTLKLGLVLPDSSIGMTQTVGGTATTDLTDGIFRVVSLTPTPGANALSGGVTTLESVDDTVTTYNGQPYVQRHYDITPAANAASAQATVTLYYSQSDFDAYNTYVTSHGLAMPLLPTNGTDNGNVRITQYHGSFTGSAAPANYSQGTESIIPFVAWDATDGWWTVSFPVAGFSGFFLSTMSGPLPLTLLNFTAVAQGGTNLLKWQTTDETGTSRFVVQRSGDGHSYTSVGTVAATDLPGVNGYSFTDAKPLTGDNFYRLQMIDLDGKFTYSPVVAVKSGPLAAGLAAWPNPARYLVSLRFGSVSGGYVVLVYDGVGRCMDRIEGTAVNGVNRLDIRLAGYAAGIYTVVIEDRDGRRTTKIKKE